MAVDEFAHELLDRISRTRRESAAAAEADDWFGEEILRAQLDDLRRLAAEHGLDVAVS